MIITGEEEGLFGWIAVNYLVDAFSPPTSTQGTYGFLDMGGASTQIAFEPSSNVTGSHLVDVRLRLLNGEIVKHKVFVTTWLGYGTNQARERYVDHLISTSPTGEVQDPCLPQDLTLPSTSGSRTIRGTGSFKSCLNITLPLLNNTAPCPDSPCLMNGIHVPKIDFAVDHFIGVSEYWFSSEHIFGLGGPYSFVEYESAAVRFCSRSWEDILSAHEKLVNGGGGDPHVGDGEVEDESGRIVQVGKWDPGVEISRLEMQCFKAAWIVNVLHEGIGMPRIVDSPSNSSTSSGDDHSTDEGEGGEKIASQASQKGFGRPTFQSADTIGDIAITWTLGKMVLEASKEIPGASPSSSSLPSSSGSIKDTHSDGELGDPLDEEVSRDPNFPIHKIRPPWNFNLTLLDDKLSLSSSSLKSPSVFLLFLVFLVLMFVTIPSLRRVLRGGCLRALRDITSTTRRRARAEVYNLNLEEGSPFFGGGSPTRNRYMRTISRIFSSAGAGASSQQGQRPERFSPRALSFVNGNPNSNSNGNDGLDPKGAASAVSISRSPSPIPIDADTFPGSVPIPFPLGAGGGGGGGLGPRSRNTSQGSLVGGTRGGYPYGRGAYRE